MYLLAIDTATNAGGVALSRNREVVALVTSKKPLRYSDRIVPMLDFVLSLEDIQLREVGCLAVAAGPGSFTGTRIGVAAAKALGQATGIPAVGISTLEALAYRHRRWERPLAIMIDARRQQVYGAAYHPGERLECLVAPGVSRPEAFLKRLGSGDFLFAGDGALCYRGAVQAAYPGARVLEGDNRLLEALCELGYQRCARGQAAPVGQLRANYVRPPDVELNHSLTQSS